MLFIPEHIAQPSAMEISNGLLPAIWYNFMYSGLGFYIPEYNRFFENRKSKNVDLLTLYSGIVFFFENRKSLFRNIKSV